MSNIAIPSQTSYLSPFTEDSPAGLGKWIQIYNLFVKIGDSGEVGFNSSRFTDIGDTMPAVSARVYDPLEVALTCDSTTTSVFSIKAGQVVVNNTLIQLNAFTTNFAELEGHWSTGGTYGGWDFTTNTVSSAVMCVLFEPYDEDGLVDPDEPRARIVYVRNSQIDYSIMAPIWCLRVTKSGSTITNAQLLLETPTAGIYIEQIGYWKNFIVDGGDLD